MTQARGFEFPGRFELSAMGAADGRLEQELPELIEALGLVVYRDSLRVRASREGRYVSVTIAFEAQSRADYDAAHSALRAHPGVRWTL
jgi:putative lipoic acid-binding regulatory protein